MLLSAHTELGLFDFSAEVPLSEQLENAIWANVNAGAVNFDPEDAHNAGIVYAWAMSFARALRAAGRLEAQIDPDTVLELLPAREYEFGLVVQDGSTIAERRAELAARMRVLSGGTRGNIRQALVELLGDAFVELRETSVSEANVSPSDSFDLSLNHQLPTVPRASGELVDEVSVTGVVKTVRYQAVGGGAGPELAQSARVLLDAGISVLRETVTAIGRGTSGGYKTFTAEFQKAHAAGTVFTTMSFPAQTSTKRHSLVVVTAEAAGDPETRRRVHELMGRMCRGVSTWSIVGALGPLTLGSATLGRLGTVPFGEISIP